MRPFLDQVPALARRPVDLTSLGDAFGATDPTVGTSGGALPAPRLIPVWPGRARRWLSVRCGLLSAAGAGRDPWALPG